MHIRADSAQHSRMNIYTAYPPVPQPMIAPTLGGRGLPDAPGVYFVWDDDVVVYVGQSRSLCRRAKISGHYKILAHHMLSYVLLPQAELTWAECYYIGVLRPIKNFGTHASHRRPPMKPKQPPPPGYFDRFKRR